MSALRWRSWPRALIDAAKVLGAMGLSVSALFAAWQYGVSRHDLHVAQTFALVDKFEGDRQTAAQVEAITRAADAAANARLGREDKAAWTEAERALLRDRLFVEAVLASRPDHAGDVPDTILNVMSFFDEIQICVEQGLCDATTAHAFLDPYADSLWTAYAPVTRYMRAGRRPHFAEGLERFVRMARSRPS